MTVKLKCPECQKNYSLSDELRGKKVKCKCGFSFRIPEKKGAKKTPAPTPVPKKNEPAATGFVIDTSEEKGPKQETNESSPRKKPAYRKRRDTLPTLILAFCVLVLIGLLGGGAYLLKERDKEQKENQSTEIAQNQEEKGSDQADDLAKADASETGKTATKTPTSNPKEPEPVSAPWSVRVEASPQPLTLTEDNVPRIPVSGSRSSVVFPHIPSLFVGVQEREFVESKVVVYNLKTSDKLGQVDVGNVVSGGLVISPSGQHVAAVHGREKIVQVWSVETGKLLNKRSLETTNTRAEFVGQDQLVIVSKGHNEIVVWDFLKDEVKATIALGHRLQSLERELMAVTAKGSYLVLSWVEKDSKQPRLEVYNLQAGTLAGVINITGTKNPVEECLSLTISDDGKELVGVFECTPKDGPGFYLLAWNLDNGLKTVSHDYEKDFARARAVAKDYRGRRLEVLPKNLGWLYQGHYFIERRTGKVAWIMERDEPTEVGPLRILPGDYWLLYDNSTTNQNKATTAFRTIYTPMDELGGRAELVQVGGPGMLE